MREEIGLMTADHPMVRNSIDLLLSAEAGNSTLEFGKRLELVR